MRFALPPLALVAALSSCVSSTDHHADRSHHGAMDLASSEQALHHAHDEFVAAINANDFDRIMAMLTDDVVFLAAHAPPIIGKAAVGEWIQGYMDAFVTHWDKPSEELIVTGHWAFQRYSYTSTDRPHGGGDPIVDTGWGLAVYHLDDDGQWRVARDSFGSDQPLAMGE